MKLSACIVVYNGYDEALKAAQTVLRFTRRHPLTLYLVDNASPDGSGQKLEAALHSGLLAAGEVIVRCRTENGGFGTGHNMVLPELDSDYHFILNPDIQLTADTLSDLADWMDQHPDVVMARPALVFPDGRPQQLPLRRCALRPMVYRQLPALRFWAPAPSGQWAASTRSTSCMWKTPTSPRRCALRARHILCRSSRPSTPGTAPPTAASSLLSGRPATCCGTSPSGDSGGEPSNPLHHREAMTERFIPQKTANDIRRTALLQKNFCKGPFFLAFFSI